MIEPTDFRELHESTHRRWFDGALSLTKILYGLCELALGAPLSHAPYFESYSGGRTPSFPPQPESVQIPG